MKRPLCGLLLALATWSLPGARVTAQELETRYYTNIPVGLNLLQFGYARSTGNILIDQTLPVEGLDATLNLTQLKYGRTIDFFGKAGKVEALLPVAFGHWTGTEIGVGDRERDITGLADARFTLNVNFVGSPALRLREFRDYLGGQTLSQEAIFAVQGHVVYSFRPGLWLGFDLGYLDGGTTTIDGRRLNTLQSNSRAGLTLQVPFAKRHGIRVAFSRGVRTRIGADFTTLVFGYQVMWGKGL